jgi:acetyl esterase/lipase
VRASRLGFLAVLAVVAILTDACSAAPPAGTPGGATASPTSTPAVATVAPTTGLTPLPSIDAALPAPDAVDVAGTCAGGALCTLMDVATWRAIPFTPEVACSGVGTTCRVLANIYGPTHAGNWPLFVLVSGADEYETPDGANSAYIDDFAKQLAGRGAVVMRANWRRGPSQGAGFPSSFADIGCAIGVSRKIGGRYGADPSRLVLVGHSSGGWASTIVGLSATPFVPAAGSCNEVAGSLRPDAWAGMAPALDHATVTFIGADASQKPEAWQSVDAFALVAKASAADRLPATLIVGDQDTLLVDTRRLDAALVKAGFDRDLIVEANADHPGILVRTETVDALLALSARARTGP